MSQSGREGLTQLGELLLSHFDRCLFRKVTHILTFSLHTFQGFLLPLLMVIFLPFLKHVWDTESECATLSVINFAGNLVHVRPFLSCFATHFSALIPWVRHISPVRLEQQIFDSLMVHSTSARNVQVVAVHCVHDSAAACCMHFFFLILLLRCHVIRLAKLLNDLLFVGLHFRISTSSLCCH